MPKVIYKKIYKCTDCPYFHFEHVTDNSREVEDFYMCGFTDKILYSAENYTDDEIPSWCPLEEYDLWHHALDAIKSEK